MRQRIGAAVRSERNRVGWSAAELARRAGISKASVSQLESGTGNPSVETLWSLSDALGVPFSTLVDPGSAGPTLIRATDAPPITAAGSAYSASLLSACPTGARRDIYLVKAEPGDPRRSAPHQVGTTEHVIVVSGSADVGPPDDPQRLGPGDYASYRGDSEHIFAAHDPGTVAILISELR
ncbi:helix-turn-helix domain-containing protein [Microbacterium sp.]|uniref:helix-turn-helix domain-containing protein n=1 Tax=Microbacterium sp. TaxID=51671 RepID=UPI0039E71E26